MDEEEVAPEPYWFSAPNSEFAGVLTAGYSLCDARLIAQAAVDARAPGMRLEEGAVAAHERMPQSAVEAMSEWSAEPHRAVIFPRAWHRRPRNAFSFENAAPIDAIHPDSKTLEKVLDPLIDKRFALLHISGYRPDSYDSVTDDLFCVDYHDDYPRRICVVLEPARDLDDAARAEVIADMEEHLGNQAAQSRWDPDDFMDFRLVVYDGELPERFHRWRCGIWDIYTQRYWPNEGYVTNPFTGNVS